MENGVDLQKSAPFYLVFTRSRLYFVPPPPCSPVFPVIVQRSGKSPEKARPARSVSDFPKPSPRPPWAVTWAVGWCPAPRLHQPGENVAFSLGIGAEMALVASKKFLMYNYYRK